MTIKNKITIDPKKMLDGYDGVQGKEYLWQILEDQRQILNMHTKLEYSNI